MYMLLLGESFGQIGGNPFGFGLQSVDIFLAKVSLRMVED